MFFPGMLFTAGSQERRSEMTHNALARRSNVSSVFVFTPKFISIQSYQEVVVVTQLAGTWKG